MNELSPQEEFSNSLPPVWKEKLAEVEGESFFKDLMRFLKSEYQASKTIYPSRENVMRALKELDLPSVKVVILGQDPYHGADQAIGFSFAVPNHLFPKPPSLVNIFKELESDLQVKISRNDSDLTGWVEQGVLLLNTVLTVEASKPLSHRDRGWEKFTDQVIGHLGSRPDPLVFILWGSHARKMKAKIDLSIHKVIETPHPSPLSAYRGFFGSKVFSRTNEFLKQLGKEPINWAHLSVANHLQLDYQ